MGRRSEPAHGKNDLIPNRDGRRSVSMKDTSGAIKTEPCPHCVAAVFDELYFVIFIDSLTRSFPLRAKILSAQVLKFSNIKLFSSFM